MRKYGGFEDPYDLIRSLEKRRIDHETLEYVVRHKNKAAMKAGITTPKETSSAGNKYEETSPCGSEPNVHDKSHEEASEDSHGKKSS